MTCAVNTLAEDLRAAMLAVSDVSYLVDDERVHYLHVPQGYAGPYIWFARSGSGDDETRGVSDSPGRTYDFVELFDVESIAQTNMSAELLAGYLKSAFDSKRGALGNGTVQAVFVRQHGEDYVPRGILGDDGSFVHSLQFEVKGYAPEPE